MINFIILFSAFLLTGFLSFSRKLRDSSGWKAIITPLASIMGSGFLVSAPLLAGVAGNLALFAMATLLTLAFLIGGAIRFNIKHFEPIEHHKGAPQKVAFFSRIVLAGAYFISITYYLQLLAVFTLNGFDIKSQWLANSIASGLLISICGLGLWRGLSIQEKLEKYIISLNLGMIGALILGLAVYNLDLFLEGHWNLQPIQPEINFDSIRVLLGLLIVVQGFETSRYLGNEHSPEQRISTMRSAQIISSIIYLLFISLVTVLFKSNLGADVTAIISMTTPVAIVLPLLISIAAIGSQFSAAVADTEGAGGLLVEISGKNISSKISYIVILAFSLGITWLTDVNEIIAYASRAFALFYTLQCLVAFLVAWQLKKLSHRRFKLMLFSLLALTCFFVFLFGLPSE